MEEKLSERDVLSIDAEKYIGESQRTISGRLFQTNGPLAAKLLSNCNLDWCIFLLKGTTSRLSKCLDGALRLVDILHVYGTKYGLK